MSKYTLVSTKTCTVDAHVRFACLSYTRRNSLPRNVRVCELIIEVHVHTLSPLPPKDLQFIDQKEARREQLVYLEMLVS